MQYVSLSDRLAQSREARKVNAQWFVGPPPYEGLDHAAERREALGESAKHYEGSNPYEYDYKQPPYVEQKVEKQGHQLWGGGGYGDWKFQQDRIRAKVGDLIPVLHDLMMEYRCDAIAVTGQSGIVMAGALQFAADFPIVTVRKQNEHSHGTRLEGPSGLRIRRVLLLDDFVASGNTVRNVQEAMPDADVVCVLEHANSGCHTDVAERVDCDFSYSNMPPVFKFVYQSNT